MDTVALILAVVALLAASASVPVSLLVQRSRRSHPSTVDDKPPSPYRAEVLTDPRSFLQEALETLDEAVPVDGDGLHASPSRQIINLMRTSPLLVFSEVVDDRVIARVESASTATRIWIITSDEWIEFEYPDSGVSFSPVVLDNMRNGRVYRYLVHDTSTTRRRAARLNGLVATYGLSDRFEIRFLTNRYFAGLGQTTEQLFILDEEPAPRMYYLFPGTNVARGARRWIAAPASDAQARLSEVQASWDLARTGDKPLAS
jgi:hypothetical protein